MNSSASLVGLFSAGIVLVVGLPFVAWKHRQLTPDPACEAVQEVAVAVADDSSEPVESESCCASEEEVLFDREEFATTLDVQEYDQLSRALKRLQSDAKTLGAESYRREALDRTLAYLGFEEAEEQAFVAVVDGALEHLSEARAEMKRVHVDTAADPESPDAIAARRGAWSRWQAEQTVAGDMLVEVLMRTPRHRLLAEDGLRWLLRLDYSIQRAG